MTTRISDLHIAREDALPTPLALQQELPCSEAQAAHIAHSRDTVRRILRGEDPRLLVIVGPCSIHDPASAIEYAGRLREVMDRTADALFPVMRVYFEKPRTRMGWKGLIYDPGPGRRGRHRRGPARGAAHPAGVRAAGRARRLGDPRPGHAAVLRRAPLLGRHRRAHRGEPAASPDGFRAVGTAGLQERDQRQRAGGDRRHPCRGAAAPLSQYFAGRPRHRRHDDRQPGCAPGAAGRQHRTQLRRGERGGGRPRARRCRPAAAAAGRLQPRQQRQGLPPPARSGRRYRAAGRGRLARDRGRAAGKPSRRRPAGHHRWPRRTALRPERDRRLHRLG